MTCYKVDSNLTSDDKFLDLIARLKVGKRDAFWNLTRFWAWVSEKHPEGVLRNISDFVIAQQADWQGEAKAFVDALVNSRFIDRESGALVVHDWEEWRSDSVRQKVRRMTKDRRTSDERPTNVSSEQYISLSFPVFKTNGKTKTWLLEKERITTYAALYPGIDTLLECKKAWQWVEDNPTKRKTANGMAKFLSGWLERAQNKPKSNAGSSPSGRNWQDPIYEEIKRKEQMKNA